MSCIFQPGFDYTIAVPEPKGDYSKNEEDCDFNFSLDGKNDPVIILFGWAGCTDKNLGIYSKIYEAKGLMTIRFVVSVPSMFLWKQHINPISEKMVRVIEDLKLAGQPIFAHCFSNGGSYLYQHFVEAVRSSTTPIVIKGVIFDSAPCRRSAGASFRAIRRTVNQNKFLNLPFSVFLQVVFLVIWMYELIETYIFRIIGITFKPMEYLIKEENRCPQHFIYSKSDKVIPWEDVELFINKRKSIGVDVSVKCYEETEHVRHYPVKKYTYTQSIFNFISQCLDLESSIV